MKKIIFATLFLGLISTLVGIPVAVAQSPDDDGLYFNAALARQLEQQLNAKLFSDQKIRIANQLIEMYQAAGYGGDVARLQGRLAVYEQSQQMYQQLVPADNDDVAGYRAAMSQIADYFAGLGAQYKSDVSRYRQAAGETKGNFWFGVLQGVARQ